MTELPEAIHLCSQLRDVAVGRTVEETIANQNPHGFGWFSGDPASYPARLNRRRIESVETWGAYVVLHLSGSVRLILGEGARMRWLGANDLGPAKHQLHLRFDSGERLVVSVQMYGFLLCEDESEPSSPYPQTSRDRLSPLSSGFTLDVYREAVRSCPVKLSLKGVLATDQRFPGLGNGVLQDILFCARMSPRRLWVDLSEDEIARLWRAVVETLSKMAAEGGRDLEPDLFGNPGGYRCVLGRHSVGCPCPVCGSPIVKATYMGGSVYTCPSCQAM
jgi:formamidopyrimidine-DNA glycosylase